jgi:hypothetical protein
MHQEGITLHLGINYILAPPPEINKKKHLAFQSALMDAGVDFNMVNVKDNNQEISVEKKTPLLQVRVIAASGAPVGQLLILAPHPNRTFETFGREAQAIVEAFDKTWESQKQILSCDSTIRYLYETSSEHAFKELWETLLRQSESSLSIFGRPVLGGGLRFVMPPTQHEEDPAQVEVKIESYLRDTKKIFIEVEFKWQQPKPRGFEPVKRLKTVDNYIKNNVITFINEGHNE